ncbi:CD40 ligand [Bombina bombina]|uniref:CD40 ligand n=1 Tax=Bombina bombina TaxID=8345 RepID=UPI00235B19A2|nr:CD40 ligand [Bombina bombina]
MINSFNQTASRYPSQEGSLTSTMKTVLCIFTLFFVAQIIGTCFFGVYFYKRMDKVEEELSFDEDYSFLRKIHKCIKGQDVDSTLLNCEEVVARFHSLLTEKRLAPFLHMLVSDTFVVSDSDTLTASDLERLSQDSSLLPSKKEAFRTSNNLTQKLGGSIPSTDVPHVGEKDVTEKEKSQVAVHLVGEKNTNSQVLQWMEKGYTSMRKQITYANGKLQVDIPGIYYIYSQVSFCLNSTQFSRAPFTQNIFLSRPHETDKLLLKGANTFVSQTTDCSLHSIQQGGVFTFRQGDQLFVNVTDSSRINYSPGLTYFGMFKL